MDTMKRTLLITAIALGAACAVPAFAAGGNYNWSGRYGGLNLGDATASSNLKTFFGPNVITDPVNVAPFDANGSVKVHPSGFTGGIQAGVNHQTGHIVYGLEVDIDALDLSSSKREINPYVTDSIDFYNVNQSIKTTWLATARPRIGLASGNALVYITGGVAFTDISYHENFIDSADIVEHSSKTSDETGSVIGGGISYEMQNDWSITGEYLYTNFGKVSSSGIFTEGVNQFGSNDHTSNLTASIFRLALNHKF